MFSARKWAGIDTGYTSSSRAPFKYNRSCGPGTLEITTLKSGRLRASPESTLGAAGAIKAAAWATFSRRDMRLSFCLAALVDCTIFCRRATGSATSVARLARRMPTWLPPSSTPLPASPCSDTGTMAIKGAFGSAACASRWRRRAPAQMARVTSFTVALPALPMALSRASEKDCAAKRREPEMLTLNGVGGA